jgi:hypothetical protein
MAQGLQLIAAKAPEPGLTKTRLGATIGMVRSAALYATFLVDLAARFTPRPDERQDFAFGWAYTPTDIDFARAGKARLRPATAVGPLRAPGW